jgi:ribosomal protein S18 acetylase RimI-like enzyme
MGTTAGRAPYCGGCRFARAVRVITRSLARESIAPLDQTRGTRGACAVRRGWAGMTHPAGEAPDPPRFVLTATPDEARRAAIALGLREFNHAQSPELFADSQDARPLDVYALDAAGRTLGGLTAHTVWDWLYIERLWIDAAARGRAYGGRLMELAEAEARRRGCAHAHVRTYSFQARGFYERHGFRIIGELDGYPPGHAFYWMRKDYAPRHGAGG